ncbi:hypothetical protein KFL_003010040 [Klebsormidium nitens]|uniref:Coenzyme Q-binding protein COQ10 START domain-containing protein n=1 Tax=Klebsormidium nitens TaxID=105231 RepID=A0A1Y1IEU3_KLENI|nr:hypothetical protein KFL_003010040 [Klebsormidium nitens]|eukprot:GAQ86628.1 hypothetical protein KFL_003010040 [Klebsormidium nitens]
MRVEGNEGRVMAQWLENNAEVRADVPLEECWEHWIDREKIPQWMPWISSVKVLEDTPDLSRWTLKYNAFDQDFTFSWVARNMQPLHHQKIHWRAVDGLANRGAVRFYKNRDGSCQIKMTISYEVPGVLAPLAQGLTPIVEGIIQKDLERFVEYARTHRLKVPATK